MDLDICVSKNIYIYIYILNMLYFSFLKRSLGEGSQISSIRELFNEQILFGEQEKISKTIFPTFNFSKWKKEKRKRRNE